MSSACATTDTGPARPTRLAPQWMVLAGLMIFAGCGTTQQNLATQQLLESDAIDAAVAQIDFTPLSDHKVYFDASYLQDYRGVGFVNSNYVVSSLRQQILSAGCMLQESRDTAEYIIEGRIGALGSDQHDVIYGLPKNNALNAVASAVPGSPALPSVPELAVAKKLASQGAAKLAMFAYDRETREPVWQSGLSIAHSTSRDTWLMGAGPFQDGTIHRDKVSFAGSRYPLRPWKRRKDREVDRTEHFASYELPALFQVTQPLPDLNLPAEEGVDGTLAEPARLAHTPDAAPIPAPASAKPEAAPPSAVPQEILPVSAEVVVEAPATPPPAESSETAGPSPVESPVDVTADTPAADSEASPEMSPEPAETPPASEPASSSAPAPGSPPSHDAPLSESEPRPFPVITPNPS